jgi:hypothetical protein
MAGASSYCRYHSLRTMDILHNLGYFGSFRVTKTFAACRTSRQSYISKSLPSYQGAWQDDACTGGDKVQNMESNPKVECACTGL